MKLIKFSYHLFCKNILMSIIIIIQLVASTLLLSDILVTEIVTLLQLMSTLAVDFQI